MDMVTPWSCELVWAGSDGLGISCQAFMERDLMKDHEKVDYYV